ncbi:MAG: DUF2793 domain-containing protein [Candidatus Heimdallarchaeota archaeon]|nr:DUF2793 domain-containing protein [Candidatus Heimdallarchaeota archaeon]
MADNTISSQIFKSKDQTTLKIIEILAQYLELNEVDLTKSSFLAFVVEALSTLTTNNLFYQISSYREFFLTKAQLSSSIYNLASFLGYTPSEASTAFVNVLFAFELSFEDSDVTFEIPEGFELSAGSIPFTTYYSTIINVLNNSTVTITVTEDNKVYNMPYSLSTDDQGNNYFSVVLPFKQFEVDVQEFQVPEDLQTYQFFDFDVTFTDITKKISDVIVEVRPSGSSGYETYTEYSSLFLMDETTKGYVKKRNDTGFSLQFGNGLIGYQPEAGATVQVTTELTKGEDGNIIAGSVTGKTTDIKTRISDDENRAVNYTVTNPAPGSGGEDEETIEEVRRNAITNLTALERLVTENDYVNTNVIIADSPISQNSLPVLKRSDIKVNEISLFSTLLYSDVIVPARNIKYNFASTIVPRGTVLTTGGVNYYTIFDMEIEQLNSVATYTYVMYEIEQIPTLVTSYNSSYDLYCDLLTVSKDGAGAEFQLDYKTTETDSDTVTCEVEILESGSTFTMTNDSTSAFLLSLPDYTVLPTGVATYFFTLKHGTDYIGQYTALFTFRKSLDDFELSNVIYDSTSYTVYDIPAIEVSYYDGIDQSDFETNVMQKLVTTLDFKDYKMTTDFVNFKLANTDGVMENMQLNDVSLTAVNDILSDPPVSGDEGDRYIILNGTGTWLGKDNQIAEISDSTSMTWAYYEPKTEQIIYVTDEAKKYIYCQAGWIIPEYEIPLQISLDIFKTSSYTGSNSDLTSEVRTAVVTAFTSRFGINSYLYRSEIIDVVQEVEGVEHCRLIKPESSIFFNFDLDKLTQEELLSYGPEYIFFEEDDIAIRIFS